jgi:hypothetical protein
MDDNDILNAATAESGLKLLALRRQKNDERLKSRFERIFEKYEYDFDGVGDEIDIVTGEVLIDNGHLETMRDEEDSDASESSRGATDLLETHSSDGELLDVGMTNLTALGLDTPGRGGRAEIATGKVAHNQASRMLDAFARPAPRLARLLVNQDDTVPQNNLNHEPSCNNATEDALHAEHRSEEQETIRLPDADLMQSMLRSNSALAQSGLDNGAIQALGLSIAAGLMKLMSTSSTVTFRKETSPSTEKAWSYPQPGHAPEAKRKRPDGGDVDVSERRRKRVSLWAPRMTRRPRKQAGTVSIGISGDSMQDQSTSTALQQSDEAPNQRTPCDRSVPGREKREPCVKRVSTLEYVSSLDPSQNAAELTMINSLRSECASLKLQGGQPYVRSEEALLRLLKKRGMLWRDIAEYFPYRNRSSIQNLYQRKLAPTAEAVDGTDGPQQTLENALTDRIQDHTPSRRVMTTLGDEQSTSVDGSRFHNAEVSSNIGSIECIPESPGHVAQDMEEPLRRRGIDQRHRPSGDHTLRSNDSDQRVSDANVLQSGSSRQGFYFDSNLETVGERKTSMQRSRSPRVASVADTQESPSAASVKHANSTGLGLARPCIFDELVQAADAQGQRQAQATNNVALRASSSSDDRPRTVYARVDSNSQIGHLHENVDTPQEGDFKTHSRLHELDRTRVESTLAKNQLQGNLSASIHSRQSPATITSSSSMSKEKKKIMKTTRAEPVVGAARGTPEKSAITTSAVYPTPNEGSNSRKDKRQSLGSANRLASRTPKHRISSITQATLSSPLRAKTPVPRRSAIGQQGSAMKSASSQRRFVETEVREINDSEDELA